MKFTYVLMIPALLFSGLMITSKNVYSYQPANGEFVPPPDKFDWIQLTSGEWLKGELKVLYNGQLEFESDKLDLPKFDMKDIKQIRG